MKECNGTTHAYCGKRLNQGGGKAQCCWCVPHSHCQFKEKYSIGEFVRDCTSVENRSKSRVRALAIKYTEDILQQYEEDFRGLITMEIVRAQKDGNPTSYLTGLYNKI